MDRLLEIMILVLITVPLGVLLGFSVVYVFNKMPAGWLCDYGEEPAPEMTCENEKRLKEYPAKLYLPMLFIVLGIYMTMQDYSFGFAALLEMWILLLIAMADKKYMIIPDQLVILLALFALPMSVFKESVRDMVYGALLGFGSMLLVAIIGKAAAGQDALGFGDVKLMAAVGLNAGFLGTAFVLVLTSVLSTAYFAIGLMRRTVKLKETRPLGPFISAAMAIYLLATATWLAI